MELQTFDKDVMMRRRLEKDSISDFKAGNNQDDRDRYELERVGKKQVLKVSIHLLRIIAELTMTAPLRPGIYDRSFLRSDVYMGKSACVRYSNICEWSISDT